MAKSPIYGRGRNRKHRAPKSPLHSSAANINMKGKKSRSDFCWCCVCIDMRDDIIRKQHINEIRSVGREA